MEKGLITLESYGWIEEHNSSYSLKYIHHHHYVLPSVGKGEIILEIRNMKFSHMKSDIIIITSSWFI